MYLRCSRDLFAGYLGGKIKVRLRFLDLWGCLCKEGGWNHCLVLLHRCQVPTADPLQGFLGILGG